MTLKEATTDELLELALSLVSSTPMERRSARAVLEGEVRACPRRRKRRR